MVDMSVRLIDDNETIRDVMNWASRRCSGETVFISLEVVVAERKEVIE